jgi:hypothetical protein
MHCLPNFPLGLLPIVWHLSIPPFFSSHCFQNDLQLEGVTVGVGTGSGSGTGVAVGLGDGLGDGVGVGVAVGVSCAL